VDRVSARALIGASFGSLAVGETEQLAAGVRKSGGPCPAGVKSDEIKGETPGAARTSRLLDASMFERSTILGARRPDRFDDVVSNAQVGAGGAIEIRPSEPTA
jgi:hypothetical protein